jgi:hypothetical protein
MPAEAAMQSIDLRLRRIRDCAALASLLKCADPSAPRLNLADLQELVRQITMLEMVVVELACAHRIEGFEDVA